MRKVLEGNITVIIIIILAGLAGCTKVNKEYWSNGTLKSEIHIKNGKYDGTATWYYEDGQKQLESFYKNNLLEGKMIRYYENGKKEEEQVYVNGQLSGNQTKWDISGNKTFELSYLNGQPDGPYKEWYPGGKLKLEGSNLKGKYNGRWYFYDERGSIVGQSDFKDGTGLQRAFYPDGKVKRATSYKNNLKDGNDIYWLENGKIDKTLVYQNGQLVSTK